MTHVWGLSGMRTCSNGGSYVEAARKIFATMNALKLDLYVRKTKRYLHTKGGGREYRYAHEHAGLSHYGALFICARKATGIEVQERLCQIVDVLESDEEAA